MAKEVKFHSEGIGLVPTSADPSNPAQGQLQYSDGTARAEGLWKYDGSDWTRLGGSGGIISDWIDFTPTGTWTTNTTYTGRYRRIGGQAEIQYKAACTGAPNAAVLLFDMPAGLSVDETKIVTSDGTSYTAGVGEIKDDSPSSSIYNLVGRYSNSVNQIAPVLHDTGLSNTRASAVTQASPITFGNTDNVILTVSLPIVGWSTGVLPNEISEGKLHTMAVNSAGGQSIPHSVTTKLTDWDTPYIDESGAWDVVNNKYVVQETGNYQVTAKTTARDFTDGDMTRLITFIYVNGAGVAGGENIISSGGVHAESHLSSEVNRILSLNQNDEIEIYTLQQNTDSDALTTLAGDSGYLSVTKLNNLASQITPAETVSANYVTNAGQLMGNNALTTVLYEDKEYDTHNAYNTSTGVYTVPISGKYLINAIMRYTLLNATNPSSFHADIFLNGSLKRRSYPIGVEEPGLNPAIPITAVLNLTAGDEIEIQGFQNNGANRNLVADSRDNFFSITKIGN